MAILKATMKLTLLGYLRFECDNLDITHINKNVVKYYCSWNGFRCKHVCLTGHYGSVFFNPPPPQTLRDVDTKIATLTVTSK